MDPASEGAKAMFSAGMRYGKDETSLSGYIFPWRYQY